MMRLLKSIATCVFFAATVCSFNTDRHTDRASTDEESHPSDSEFLDIISDIVSRHKRSAAIAEFTMSGNQNTQINDALTQKSQDSITEFNLMGGDNLTCPDTVSTVQSDPVRKRSLCPWFYEVNHTATRFPNTVLNARTPCSTCIIGGVMYECAGITQPLPILLRTETPEGGFKWVESEIPVTVGFTCAGRRASNTFTTPADSSGDTATTPDYM